MALGLVDEEVYDTIMEAIKAKDPVPVIKAVEAMLFHGFDLQEFVVGFEEYLRTLLFLSIPKALENPHLDCFVEPTRVEKMRALGFSEKTLLRMAEIIRKTEHEIKWTAFPRFSVELALLKLVYLDSTVAIEQLIETFEKKQIDTPGSMQTKTSLGSQKYKAVDENKIEFATGSDKGKTIDKANKNIHPPPLPLQQERAASSIDDEIKREPIIKSVLDIFNGDVIP